MLRRLGHDGLRALIAIQVCCAALPGCSDDPAVTADPQTAASGGTGGATSQSAGAGAVQSDTLIKLSTGSIQGKLVDNTREFLGIPYGKAPVGALRFAPPEPAEPWTSTRDATAFGPSCPQPAGTLAASGAQNEDCLSVNVFVPTAASTTKPLPVMVFIHGGAFVSGGSSQYAGESLTAAGPVVLVTLNYRLGALGFFSHPALDATRAGAPSGSDGIRDQQLALQWVHDNIAAFGGDAKNVTVFGESAGSTSVCLHLVSPGSTALRQRLIMESGSCVGGGLGAGDKSNADKVGQALADGLCAGEADAIACLRSQTPEALASWGADQGLFGPGWGPVTEGPGGVLPQTPAELLAAQDTIAPFIIGANKNEWGLFQLIGTGSKLTSVAQLKTTLEAQFGDHAAEVEAQYSAATDAEANDAFIQVVTDVTFRCPSRALTRMAAAKAGSSVFAYSFEQGTAFHAQELDYVFGNATLSAFGGGPPSQALTQTVQHDWTQFAISGVPSADWPPYDAQTESYLTLVDPPHASTGFASVCDFWDKYVANGGTIKLQ
jgi:para-nitrobenzyl esterase